MVRKVSFLKLRLARFARRPLAKLLKYLNNIMPPFYLYVLQVPHHGSKTGLNSEIITTLRPELAVISVGAKNKYNHPNPFTLQLLRDKSIEILRTDEKADIKIVSDGLHFETVK